MPRIGMAAGPIILRVTMIAPLVTATNPALGGPTSAFIAEALAVPASKAEHDRLAAAAASLHSVELAGQAPTTSLSLPITVAAWNIERCKYLPPTIARLAETGATVTLLTEMDLGMARAGNRHTTAEVAAGLGHAYAYATEYIELGLGDAREEAWHAGQTNSHSLHGNAVTAAAGLDRVSRVALDDGAVWFAGKSGSQRRIGTRCAVLAEVRTDRGPLLVGSVHLESESDPALRAEQVSRLLAAITERHGAMPAVIAGDFNTAAMPRDADPADSSAPWFDRADLIEPMFGLFAAAGFDWRTANTPAPTCRTRPDGSPKPPFNRIDWMFTRGLRASAPRVVAAVDDVGVAISDHEMITIRIDWP